MARRFGGKVFALLAIIISGLIAFFSVGIPTFVTFPEYYSALNTPQSGVLLENPLPLSFPIYASLNVEWLALSSARQYYQLHFFSFAFYRDWILNESAGYIWLKLSVISYALYCLFFVFVNLVGAAIGLWLSRRSFMDRLSKPVRRVGPPVIAIALMVMSVYLLFRALQIWSGYGWAMWRLQFPMSLEGGGVLFNQLLSAIGDYVSLLPVYLFVGIIFGTSALVIVARNSRRRVLIIAAIAIVSSAFQFFEAYKVWETYNLATHQVLGPLAYLTYFHHEATYVYQTLFWLYLLSGSIAVASGIIVITLGRLKAKMRAYRLKRQESNGILV